MPTTLDATPAHCLPPSSALARVRPAAAHLDLRRPSLARRQQIFPRVVSAPPEKAWQPRPGAIGGQEEGSKETDDRSNRHVPLGWHDAAAVRLWRPFWRAREGRTEVEI